MTMKILLAGAATLCLAASAQAQVSDETIRSLGAPDSVETSIGTLTFKDGVPDAETATKVFDAMDFANALAVYNNSFRGASAYALRKAFEELAGANGVVIFSELMDASSLFLTANADTVYYLSAIDLSDGPMVIEQPSDAVGTINDMWFSWIIDIGGPGPDRGLGGKYLIVPPGYDGPLPEGGYFVAHSKTNHILYAARAYLVNDDPKPAVENIKANLKIYPYVPGAFGTSIAQALTGAVRLGPSRRSRRRSSSRARGLAFNTIPPSDAGFFEMINENVQAEPATSYDVELAGQLAAIGIVHGKPFAPDARMQGILAEAAAVGDAAGRSLQWRWAEQHPDWAYYEGSQWWSMLWEGGAIFETPPPLFEDGMFKPLPADRRAHARFAHGLLLRLHARQPRHDHAHPRRRLAVPDDRARRDRRAVRRREDLQGDAAQGHPGARLLVVHPLRQPDPLDAADPAEVPARRQPVLSLAGRRGGRGRLDHGLVRAPSSPRAWPAATGSRPTRRRAGSPSCASTARCRRSSARSGAPAKSRWSSDARRRRVRSTPDDHRDDLVLVEPDQRLPREAHGHPEDGEDRARASARR